MPPKPEGLQIDALKPEQVVGIAVGIFLIISLLLFFCCYLKCGVGLLAVRNGRKGAGQKFENGRQSSPHKDPEMQRHHSEAQDRQQPYMANYTLPRKSSTASSSQLYVDSKIELPVPGGSRHEIDGVGRSAAMAPDKIEMEDTSVGPFELPTEPPASRQSWRTSSTTLFHYTPKPSYILNEEDEGEDEVSRGQDPHAVSPKTPTDYRSLENRLANRESGEVSPLTPMAPRGVASLSGVLEAESDERDTTKEVLSPQEEEIMLKRNRWNVWRNWGGGTGSTGAS